MDMIDLLHAINMSNLQSREPLAPQVRTKKGSLCEGFTPIQYVTVISE